MQCHAHNHTSLVPFMVYRVSVPFDSPLLYGLRFYTTSQDTPFPAFRPAFRFHYVHLSGLSSGAIQNTFGSKHGE
jgi:hypothetical protein